MNLQPSFGSESVSFDNLIAGDDPDIITESATLNTGENRVRGTVLGRITKGAGTGSKISGTGDGTIGAVTLGTKAEVGTYVLTCIEDSGSGNETWSVFSPSGYRLPDLTTAVAYTSDHINLTVADGATDWAAGAIINVVVAVGSGNLKRVESTATDGSNEPYGILVEDVDATSADAECSVYVAGVFNLAALNYGTSINTVPELADMIAGLRDKGIFIKQTVSAS